MAAKKEANPKTGLIERDEVITEGYESWLTLEEAAEELGCSSRTILRKVKSGDITRFRCRDKVYRYRPEDLEDLDAQVDLDEQKLQKEASAELVKQCTVLIAQLANTNQQLIERLTDPIDKVMKSWGSQLEQANKRIETLDAKNLQMLELREEMLSERHDRILEEREQEAINKRKDQAFDTLRTQVAPTILAHLAGKHPADVKSEAVLKFLGSIKPELWQMLLIPENDLLTDEQKLMIRSMVPGLESESPVSEQAAPETADTKAKTAQQPLAEKSKTAAKESK